MYPGIALNSFSFEAHFDYANTRLVEERFTLSNKMNVYVAADKDELVILKCEHHNVIVSRVEHTCLLIQRKEPLTNKVSGSSFY